MLSARTYTFLFSFIKKKKHNAQFTVVQPTWTEANYVPCTIQKSHILSLNYFFFLLAQQLIHTTPHQPFKTSIMLTFRYVQHAAKIYQIKSIIFLNTHHNITSWKCNNNITTLKYLMPINPLFICSYAGVSWKWNSIQGKNSRMRACLRASVFTLHKNIIEHEQRSQLPYNRRPHTIHPILYHAVDMQTRNRSP